MLMNAQTTPMIATRTHIAGTLLVATCVSVKRAMKAMGAIAEVDINLAPGRPDWNLGYIIIEHILLIYIFNFACCPQMNVNGLPHLQINIGSDNGLVPSVNKS